MPARSSRIVLSAAFALGVLWLPPGDVAAQQPPEPAPPAAGAQQGQLPEVEVIQKKEAAPKAAKKAAPAAKKAAPPPEPAEPEVVEAPEETNPIYGASASSGAAARAESGPSSPINPTSLIPGNLEGFPSAATRVDSTQIDQERPRTTNEIFNRVPGVHVVSDDGFARHGGIGIRGSPPRRGRKVLTMEDGQPINMSVWLDPSVHYVPPLDRIESVEVLRGTVITHGPLNNHGVVNFRNLSPFGRREAEITAAIGTTENDSGVFIDNGDTFTSIIDNGPSNTRHVHARHAIGNVGAAFAYSGAEVDGAWDTERLRYNDFYSVVGWKGTRSDLTLSGVFFRQRDDYDEANLEGEAAGEAENLFFNQIEHCKSCFNPGSRFNTYNADVYKLQLIHNYYFNDTTTLTSRVYAFDHRRDRYQNFEGEDPSEADDGFVPTLVGDDVFIPEGVMLGRLRTYRQLGAEVRAEFADRPFLGTMRQDIQTGVRYEYNDFTNKNFFGTQGQILEDGDETGLFVFNRDTAANAVSAFLQTAIHVTDTFTVTPGARLEHYTVNRKTFILSEEEGEGEEHDDCLADAGFGGFGNEECVEIELSDDFDPSDGFDKTYVLPGVALAWTGLPRTTFYGGYHRGLTPGVLREAAFPPGDEIGDNFQIGARSTALRGLTFDIAAFHQRIEDFQVKGSSTDAVGNNIYTNIDEVEINGFEVLGRVDSHPWIGGSANFFFVGNYTLSDSVIEKGLLPVDDDDDGVPDRIVDLEGNLVPEVPRHFANLTVGVEHRSGWDASFSWTYRGSFFTDELNTAFGASEEGEDGEVPDVWLLSARANVKLGDTGGSLFIAGDNLLDELYIVDREDGIKPGQGRTIWGGFKYKLN